MSTNEDEWTVVVKSKHKSLNDRRYGNPPSTEVVQRKPHHPMAKPPRYNTRDLSRNPTKNGANESRNSSAFRRHRYPDNETERIHFPSNDMRGNFREDDKNPKSIADENKYDWFRSRKDGKEAVITKRPGVIVLPKGNTTTTKKSKKKNKTDKQYLKSVNQLSLNLTDVLKEAPITSDVKKTKISTGVTIRPQTHTSAKDKKTPRNVLDSSAPLTHRGKERIAPKRKKPTKLKRLVLEERKLHRLQKTLRKPVTLEDNDIVVEEGIFSNSEKVLPLIKVTFVDSDSNEKEIEPEYHPSDNTLSTKEDICDRVVNNELKDEVEISKVEEEIDLNTTEQETQNEIVSKPEVLPELETFQASFIGEGLPGLHTKKFREYCNQMPDAKVDELTTKLLYELMRLQARQHDMNKIKSKGRKRLVFGFHEVTKHLRVQNLKCIVIARDLERSRAIGGLEHQIITICSLCNSQNVKVIFALTKSTLSFSVCKPRTIVSIVGILNYEGRQQIYKDLVQLVTVKQQEYYETVRVKRKELQNKESLLKNVTEVEVNCEPADSELNSNSTDVQDDVSIASSGSRKKKRNKNKQTNSETPLQNMQIKKFELKDVEITEFVPNYFLPPELPYTDVYPPPCPQSGVEYYSYSQVYSSGAYLYYPYSLDPYNY